MATPKKPPAPKIELVEIVARYVISKPGEAKPLGDFAFVAWTPAVEASKKLGGEVCSIEWVRARNPEAVAKLKTDFRPEPSRAVMRDKARAKTKRILVERKLVIKK